MTGRTEVSVYAVDDDGSTGDRLGSGSLVDSKSVQVHPPLDQQLIERPRALRVGIAAGDGTGVEVHDATTHVVERDPALVVLELSGESTAPTEQLPISGDVSHGELVTALRSVLANLPSHAVAARMAAAPARNPVSIIIDTIRGQRH